MARKHGDHRNEGDSVAHKTTICGHDKGDSRKEPGGAKEVF